MEFFVWKTIELSKELGFIGDDEQQIKTIKNKIEDLMQLREAIGKL